MDFENFEAVGKFVVVKQIEEKEEGAIAIAGDKFPFFGKATVLASDMLEVDEGDTIVYLKDNGKKFGLGEPDDVYVIEIDDVVGVILPEESEAEGESE